MPTFDPGVLSGWLSLVLQEPSAAHAWHRLYGSAVHAPFGPKQALLDHIRAQAPTVGLGGFLAATFAHALSNNVADLASASRVFGASRLPSDAGLALLHTIYATALASGAGAAGFATLMRSSGFLDVAGHLGQTLMHRAGAQRPNSLGRRHRPLRVAVVAPTLSSAFHAPTDMVLRHAGLLLDHGLETAVFSAQEFQMLDMASWLGVPRSMQIDPAQPEGWPHAGAQLAVRLSKTSLPMDTRWRALLAQISQFAPDVVLFIGPYSPLLPALYQRYPVVGLGSNTLPPVGPLNVWLAPKPDAQPAWTPNFTVGRSVVYSHRFSLKAAVLARNRQAMGLPENAVVWVTTGSRLAREISPEWRNAVLAALDRHPDCHWLLVGVGKDELAKLPTDHPRVHVRGFDTELPALLKACNLYLNPPRMGGGHSVACAMAQGLAVLALPGSDGGDKLGQWVQPDTKSYFLALDQLTGDTPAQRQLGEQLRQHYLDTFDLASGASGLLAVLEDAAQGKTRP